MSSVQYSYVVCNGSLYVGAPGDSTNPIGAPCVRVQGAAQDPRDPIKRSKGGEVLPGHNPWDPWNHPTAQRPKRYTTAAGQVTHLCAERQHLIHLGIHLTCQVSWCDKKKKKKKGLNLQASLLHVLPGLLQNLHKFINLGVVRNFANHCTT